MQHEASATDTACCVHGTLYRRIWDARRAGRDSPAFKALYASDRYKAVLDFPKPLWEGEQTAAEAPGPNAQSTVYFDWFAFMENPPAYAHDPNPKDVMILSGSFEKYSMPGSSRQPVMLYEVDRPGAEGLIVWEPARDAKGFPLNPRGHTGVMGRGVLGHWGPNHAGDAIVTRKSPKTGKLQVALIERTDGSGQFALPGGFVDPGEFTAPVKTVIREFLEEAVGRESANSRECLQVLEQLFGPFDWDSAAGTVTAKERAEDGSEVFRWGALVYAGYVDDERNTDNAWMETTALHWHLTEEQGGKLKLQAGDDARPGSAAFYDMEDDAFLSGRGVQPLENLFASHSKMLKRLLQLRPDLLAS